MSFAKTCLNETLDTLFLKVCIGVVIIFTLSYKSKNNPLLRHPWQEGKQYTGFRG